MSSVSHFQNNEYIIPFDHVSHLMKHPPDRLEIITTSGATLTILGEDCKDFLQNYLTYLKVKTRELTLAAQQSPTG